jgi:hypothetical protein
MQDLDPIATPVDEQKQAAVERIGIELLADDPGQAVERGNVLMPLAAGTVRNQPGWSRSSILVILSMVRPSP